MKALHLASRSRFRSCFARLHASGSGVHREPDIAVVTGVKGGAGGAGVVGAGDGSGCGDGIGAGSGAAVTVGSGCGAGCRESRGDGRDRERRVVRASCHAAIPKAAAAAIPTGFAVCARGGAEGRGASRSSLLGDPTGPISSGGTSISTGTASTGEGGASAGGISGTGTGGWGAGVGTTSGGLLGLGTMITRGINGGGIGSVLRRWRRISPSMIDGPRGGERNRISVSRFARSTRARVDSGDSPPLAGPGRAGRGGVRGGGWAAGGRVGCGATRIGGGLTNGGGRAADCTAGAEWSRV